MDIIGKWQQPAGQPFPGLWFRFNEDGTFQADFEEMGVTSSGTYTLAGGEIDMDQTRHSFGMIGHFKGLWAVEGSVLKMAVGLLNQARPADLSGARVYEKIG
jgi:hypothetical protein